MVTMADQPLAAAEPSMSALAGGIINDVQDLVKQQLALFQNEIKKDIHQIKEAALVLIWGVGIAFAGICLLGVMAAYLIYWSAPALPLWICFAIAGAGLFGLGAALFLVGKRKLDSLNPLPNNSVDVMKENVQWVMKNNQKK
jgi:hypothetical protein